MTAAGDDPRDVHGEVPGDLPGKKPRENLPGKPADKHPAALGDKIRVLFVDDEPHVIAALYRSLRTSCRDWDMRFATSSEEALVLVNKHAVDVVVADISLDGMPGTDLLRIIKERFPRIVRVILSGMIHSDAIVESAKYAEIRLCKPCSAEQIRAAIVGGVEARRKSGG